MRRRTLGTENTGNSETGDGQPKSGANVTVVLNGGQGQKVPVAGKREPAREGEPS